MIGSTPVTTGPYLQKATSNSVLVRWYTGVAVDSKVTYGTDPDDLSQSVTISGTRTNHSVPLTGLNHYTKYYYSVGTSSVISQSGPDNYFLTLPDPVGTTEQKYTFWVTGDVGNNSSNQRNVRDRFIEYMGNNVANGWLLLGDNAYTDGFESVYITNFFDVYEGNVMRKIPLWPATGNHEYENSGVKRRNYDVAYFKFFDPPTSAEAGGRPSNTEAYYSFDYGNIHFIALDSYIIETVGTNEYLLYNTAGPQVQWLIQDLQANTKEWTIVYFHHPPYTMGSHNSDTESDLRQIRQNLVVPILEQYNVDLVLTGHSHSYERSKLMKGHSGLESTFLPLTHHLSQSSGYYDGTSNSCPYVKNSPNSGTVYAVAGSAGQLSQGQNSPNSNPPYVFPHDALPYANDDIAGSLILEIEGNRLDAKWLASDGNILDKFTMMKNVNKINNISINEGQSVDLTASWIGQYDWDHSVETNRSVSVAPTSTTTYTVWDQYSCIHDEFIITVTPLPVEFVNFSARSNDEDVTLNWKTATELNNDYFEVQRFVDSEQPSLLAKVQGHGTTNEMHQYEYQDVWPINGVAYYRLKQVDFDGKYEYSNIVRVNYDGARSIKLYPNPGDGGTLKLALGMDEGPLFISILDPTGRLVSTSSTNTLSDNSLEIRFDPSLTSGMYFIQIKSNSGITTRKWIVR